ncbi:peptidoglycan-binding domain-containing protein, partial [Pseudomonas aeruginosa]
MGTVLKRGDRGSAVEDLQMKLRVAGYAVSADGIFGGDTEKAVRDFQASKALVVDGKVGPATLAELAKSATVPAKWEAIPFPT